MADEPVVEPVEPVVEPAVEPEVHPLEEGGRRFNEVYARMKAAEEREREKDARLARLEGMAQVAQRPQVQQQVYTPEQLQVLVDQGRVTPMAAANYLAQQHAQQAAMQTTSAAIQLQQLNAKVTQAANEVNAFIDKVPSLRDTQSAEFQKVSQVAYQTAEDMGLPVTDFRVQRAALRQVYGSIERIASNGAARETARSASVPHTETGVGGTNRPAASKGDDALKGISQKYIDFWTKKGYSRERMVEEAKYVTREPRSVPVNR